MTNWAHDLESFIVRDQPALTTRQAKTRRAFLIASLAAMGGAIMATNSPITGVGSDRIHALQLHQKEREWLDGLRRQYDTTINLVLDGYAQESGPPTAVLAYARGEDLAGSFSGFPPHPAGFYLASLVYVRRDQIAMAGRYLDIALELAPPSEFASADLDYALFVRALQYLDVVADFDEDLRPLAVRITDANTLAIEGIRPAPHIPRRPRELVQELG